MTSSSLSRTARRLTAPLLAFAVLGTGVSTGAEAAAPASVAVQSSVQSPAATASVVTPRAGATDSPAATKAAATKAAATKAAATKAAATKAAATKAAATKAAATKAAATKAAAAKAAAAKAAKKAAEARAAARRKAPPGAPTPAPAPVRASGDTASQFVYRSGSSLYLAGAPFRFSGSNMYWLALDDNVRDASGQPTLPSRYRIDDAMATAALSGGTVVRTWASTVGCARCIQPQLGQFNDAGFASLDYAVASAARNGQRMVLNLVDNWDYYHGSKLTYTRWRGKPESAFFSDPQIIADYENHITKVVNHVNPWTGVAYKDDPTIMAWETGNEMWCQTCAGNFWDGSWTRAIANHIKSVAPRQLVVDGHGTDPACEVACLHQPSLDIPSVDMVDDHFYPMNVNRVRTSSALAAKHGKGYLIGEYDWANARGGSSLNDFLAAIETNPVSGDLIWAIIPHADTTGFVDHNDGFQMLYPGRTPDEQLRSRRLMTHAAVMSAKSSSAILAQVVAQPALTSIVRNGNQVELTWRGVAGATTYEVARTDASSRWGTWTTVATVNDHRVMYGPTWVDTSLAAGQLAGQPTYRIRARGLSGAFGPWSATQLPSPAGL